MENGGGEGGERTIRRAFIRTAQAESDKNQESLEKTWRRGATQQLKTSLEHHSERILDSTVRKKKNLILKGGLEARGGIYRAGGTVLVCYRLVSAALSPLSVNISCI